MQDALFSFPPYKVCEWREHQYWSTLRFHCARHVARFQDSFVSNGYHRVVPVQDIVEAKNAPSVPCLSYCHYAFQQRDDQDEHTKDCHMYAVRPSHQAKHRQTIDMIVGVPNLSFADTSFVHNHSVYSLSTSNIHPLYQRATKTDQCLFGEYPRNTHLSLGRQAEERWYNTITELLTLAWSCLRLLRQRAGSLMSHYTISAINNQGLSHCNAIYWLPLTVCVATWAKQHIRIVESEADMRERLRQWNAGEPIRLLS